MCELAVVAGCDPEPRTLRELMWMAEAADKAHWNRTFALIAQLHNLLTTEDSEHIDPMQFFPWDVPQKPKLKARPITPEVDAMLSKMFPGGKKPNPPDS